MKVKRRSRGKVQDGNPSKSRPHSALQLTVSMCGRFAVGDNHEEIFQQLIRDGILPAGEEPDWVDRDEFHPRYNVAPQSRAAVIRQRSTSEGSEEVASEENVIEAQDHKILPSSTQNYTTVVQTMKWGVLPRGRTPNAPKVLNTINSKIETILEGSYLWSPLVDSKRCVVVCDGYVLVSLIYSLLLMLN